MSSKYAHLDRRRLRRTEEIQAGAFRVGRIIRRYVRPAISRLRYLHGGMRGYQQLARRVYGAPRVPFSIRRLPPGVARAAYERRRALRRSDSPFRFLPSTRLRSLSRVRVRGGVAMRARAGPRQNLFMTPNKSSRKV